MVKKWSDVAASPEYNALPDDQKQEARSQYFFTVVAPAVPADDLLAVRKQFDADTDPGLFDRGIGLVKKAASSIAEAAPGAIDTASRYVTHNLVPLAKETGATIADAARAATTPLADEGPEANPLQATAMITRVADRLRATDAHNKANPVSVLDTTKPVTPGTITAEQIAKTKEPPAWAPPSMTEAKAPMIQPEGGYGEAIKEIPASAARNVAMGLQGTAAQVFDLADDIGVPKADIPRDFFKALYDINKKNEQTASLKMRDAPSTNTANAPGVEQWKAGSPPDLLNPDLITPSPEDLRSGGGQAIAQLPTLFLGWTGAGKAAAEKMARWTPFMIQVNGPAYMQGRESGLSPVMATLYGAGQVAAETLPEMLAFQAFLKTRPPVWAKLKESPSELLQAVKSLGTAAVAMNADEPISTAGNWGVDKLFADPTATWGRLWDDELQTVRQIIPMSAIMSTPAMAANAIIKARNARARATGNPPDSPSSTAGGGGPSPPAPVATGSTTEDVRAPIPMEEVFGADQVNPQPPAQQGTPNGTLGSSSTAMVAPSSQGAGNVGIRSDADVVALRPSGLGAERDIPAAAVPTPGGEPPVPVRETSEGQGIATPVFTHVPGREGVASTERGLEIGYRYALADADQLRTSQLDDLAPNPDYPAELQPRDRQRATSEVQITRISNDIRPQRLGESPMVAEGAPVVGPDGAVESGNGRTIALRRAYTKGKANGYYDWLEQNAGHFGFTPQQVAQMQAPVLVRVRTTPVDRVEFARQANESAELQLSPVEQAKIDAERLGHLSDLVVGENGDMPLGANRSFFTRFLSQVASPNEQTVLVTQDGQLSQSGQARIRNAVFARAYGNADLIARAAESLDNNVRSVTNGLLRAAPRIAEIRDGIARGELHPVDIAPSLAKSVGEFSRLRSEGKTVTAQLAQQGMFGDTYSPEEVAQLEMLDQNSRSANRIADFLSKYADAVLALGNPKQGGLFGEAVKVPTTEQVIRSASDQVRKENDQPRTQGLFDQPVQRPELDAGGSARAPEGGAAVLPGDAQGPDTGNQRAGRSNQEQPAVAGSAAPGVGGNAERTLKQQAAAVEKKRREKTSKTTTETPAKAGVSASGEVAAETTYFKGDRAQYTGKMETVGGQVFHEVRLLEGHMKGETKLVKGGPEPSVAAKQELAGAKQRTGENTIFTEDTAAKAREILKKKLGQLNVGLDPEMVQAGLTLAGYYIENGARKFKAYSEKMIADLGEAVRPYLRSWYESVRHYPGFEEVAKDMSTPLQVDAIIVEQKRAAKDAEPAKRKTELQEITRGSAPTTTQPAGIRPERDSSISQTIRDRILADANLFGNRANAEAIRVHGFDSFDGEIQHVVLARVRGALDEKEVARVVVQAIPVDVMNGLVGEKFSTENLLHDKSVLTSRLTVPRNIAIPEPVVRFINSLSAQFEGALARRDAEEPLLTRSPPSSELNPAVSAGAERAGNAGTTTKASVGAANTASSTGEGATTSGASQGKDGHVVVTIGEQSDTVNVTPTEAQKAAGVYKKGHIRIAGLDVSIENPMGSTRSGVDANGKTWENTLDSHYGYIRGTVGKDKDHIDVFIKPGTPPDYTGPVFVIDQKKPGNGHFDEHKILLGWDTEQDAEEGYKANYSKGWDGVRAITETDLPGFKKWLAEGDTTQPFAGVPESHSAQDVAAKEARAADNLEGKQQISDFGEKIGGARKDVWASFKDNMTRIPDAEIAAEPLSKSWPEPNYQALLDNGADSWGVAFMHAARDEIPAKPRQSYKVKRWAEQVKMLRSTATRLADGTLSVENARFLLSEFASKSRGMSDVAGRIELYQLVGHSKSLAGVRIAHGEYGLHSGIEYNPPKSIWTVEKKAAATAFSNWPRELAIGDTRAEALQNFKDKFDSLEITPKASKEVSFDIYSTHGENGYRIGKKIGRNIMPLAGPFNTVKDAREYRTNNQDELAEKLEKAKEIPRERRDTNEPRVGEDMRAGQDVTPQMFGDSFGFRGVEFGNWVEQGKRQRDLNDAYDALMDMAAILGVPPKALSLNGELGLAFGARGTGGVRPAAANYEHDKVVVNLTKKEGAGSLGHEWWHALDNYFSRMRQKGGGHMTESLDVSLASRASPYVHSGAVRKEMVEAFGEVMKAIKSTALKARSSRLDAKRSKEYWTTGNEMSARAYESYLISKLQDQGASNDYLANIVDEATWKAAEKLGFELDESYPYPTAGEVPAIRAAFDNFFRVVETKETDTGTAMFSRLSQSGEDDGRRIHLEDLHAVAQRFRASFPGIAVHVLEKESQAPKKLMEFVKENNASGSWSGATHNGEIYLLRTGLRDVEHAEEIAMHEAEHAGLRRILGDQHDAVMLNINRSNLSVQAAAVALVKKYRYSIARATNEVLADMGPRATKLNGWDKLITTLRGILRRAGLVKEWTKNDIEALVLRALAAARKPGATHVSTGVSLSATENDAKRQYRELEQRYFNDDGSEKPGAMLAPNGERSKLNKRQWIQVRTPAFKEWFGYDWERRGVAGEDRGDGSAGGSSGATGEIRGLRDGGATGFLATGKGQDTKRGGARSGRGQMGSAALDQDTGEPRVFYHGTADNIDAFDLNHPNRKDKGWLGRGVYVTTDQFIADSYTKIKVGNDGENIMPVFIRALNPFNATLEVKKMLRRSSQENIDFFTDEMKRQGFDSVKLDFGDALEVMVFDPTQVKSAIGNKGTFDIAEPDIRLSRSDQTPAPAGVFASGDRKAQVALAEAKLQKRRAMSGESITDKVLRTAFEKTGAIKITKGAGALLEKLGEYVPETIKAGIVSDYGIPEAVTDRRDLMFAHIRRGYRGAEETLAAMGGLTRAESRVAYEWMNQRGADHLLEQLPADSRKALTDLKGQIDAMSQEAVRLGQLSADAYDRNQMAYLHRSYRKWDVDEGTERQRTSRAKMKQILGEQYKGRGMTTSALMNQIRAAAPAWWGIKTQQGKADAQLKGQKFLRFERRENRGEGTRLLDGMEDTLQQGKLLEVNWLPAGEPLPEKYGAWHRDPGTWEARDTKGDKVVMWRDFTKAELVHMGEIDEVRYAVAKTLHQMTHDIEIGRYLEWLSSNHGIPDAERLPAGAKVVEASSSLVDTFKEGTWVQVPETKIAGTSVLKFGKLAGAYVPGPIWNDLRQTIGFKFGPDWYRSMLKAWKISKTALSPSVHLNNIMANFVMADWHDIRPGHLLSALEVMRNPEDPANKEIMGRFEDNGGTQGMYALSEIQRDQLAPLIEELRKEVETAGDVQGMVGVSAALQAMLSKDWAGARVALGSSKGAKITRAAYKKALDLYQAEDGVFRLAAFIKAKQDGLTDIEAGKLARRSFLDYQINAPWIQAMRQSVFPFIAFTYRAVPMLVKTAEEKPWKLMKLGLAVGALNAFGYLLSRGDEDKERRWLPDEKAGGIWGVVPKLIRWPWNYVTTNKNGQKVVMPVFLDIRRFIPVGDVFDLGQTHAAVPLIPIAIPGGPLAVLAEILANKSQFTGQAITKETDTNVEVAEKITSHLFKAFAPNLLGLPGTYATEGVWNAAKGRTDVFGREQSLGMAVASSVGFKLGAYPIDVLQRNAVLDYKANVAEIERGLRTGAREHGRDGMSDAEWKSQVQRAQAKLQKLTDKLKEHAKP